jgi:hypothetical protein
MQRPARQHVKRRVLDYDECRGFSGATGRSPCLACCSRAAGARSRSRRAPRARRGPGVMAKGRGIPDRAARPAVARGRAGARGAGGSQAALGTAGTRAALETRRLARAGTQGAGGSQAALGAAGTRAALETRRPARVGTRRPLAAAGLPRLATVAMEATVATMHCLRASNRRMRVRVTAPSSASRSIRRRSAACRSSTVAVRETRTVSRRYPPARRAVSRPCRRVAKGRAFAPSTAPAPRISSVTAPAPASFTRRAAAARHRAWATARPSVKESVSAASRAFRAAACDVRAGRCPGREQSRTA